MIHTIVLALEFKYSSRYLEQVYQSQLKTRLHGKKLDADIG